MGEVLKGMNREYEKLESLKIKDGDNVELTFLDEERLTPTQNGERVLFVVEVRGQKYNWWVNPKSYSLLRGIAVCAKNGKITNVKVKVKRTGSGRNDTRYEVA